MPFAILAGAGILGSIIGGGASIAAGAEEAQAQEQAAQLQYKMFQQVQGNEQPFLAGGQNALAALQKGLGLGPGGTGTGPLDAPFNPSNLQNTPGYQFTLNEGLDAAKNEASTTGNIGGGNTLKALTGYATGLADTTYQQQFEDYLAQNAATVGDLGSLVTLGSNAGSNSATGASTFGANIASDIAGAGASTAAGITGAGNAAAGGINNLSQNYLLAQYLQGGGGGSAAGFSNVPF